MNIQPNQNELDYQQQEAMIDDQYRFRTKGNIETPSDINRSTGSFSTTSSSNSSGNTTNHVVSFGTVTLREYERKLNVQADVDLGLTIGWKFLQHPPIDVDSFTRNEDEYREAESTSEGDRAQLLLNSGYSKRRLRSAMRRRHRQMDDGDSTSTNYKSMILPHAILSGPSRIFHKISNGAKWLLPSPSLVEEPNFLY
jgi:hypothetical protein